MLLFRSEEHLEAWLQERDMSRGGAMTVAQQWQLANTWYSNRLDPSWNRRAPEEAQQVFESCGLTGTFWQLQP